MDDVVNRFARELADAIAAAVAENPQVEACREKARAAGFEMKVTLEAVVGFVNRSQSAALTKVAAPAPAVRAAAPHLRGDRQRSPLPALAPDRRGRNRGAGRIDVVASRKSNDEGPARFERTGPYVFMADLPAPLPMPAIPSPALRPATRPARRRLRGGRIAEVVVADRLEVVVELVDERDAGRDVQLDDLRLGDVVEILHERAQAVAVRGDEHALARADRRRDRLVPVRQEARDRVLERFGQRQLGGRERRVARIARRVARVVRRQRAAAGCRSCGARSSPAPRRASPRSRPCSAPAARRSGARSAASS